MDSGLFYLDWVFVFFFLFFEMLAASALGGWCRLDSRDAAGAKENVWDIGYRREIRWMEN